MEMKQKNIDEMLYAPLFAIGKERQIISKTQPYGGGCDSKQ